MKSIILILPYFGKFNDYFQLFLNSCKYNFNINWLVYTDDKRPFSIPFNVEVKYCTFQDFKQILQRNFNFEITLDAPYKLCDFKPAYGEALQQDIEGFDFWGHCDCDLIFGDLTQFITPDILLKYNKIFSLGHLTLYKNITEVNSFYRTQHEIDYKKIYTNSKSYAFDEWTGISKVWKNYGLPFYDELVMDDVWPSSINFLPTKALTGVEGPYHNHHNIELTKYFSKMKNIVYEYKHGKLYRKWINGKHINQEEVAYVHMQKRIMMVESLYNENNFLIVPNKFISNITLGQKNIRKLSKKKMEMSDYLMKCEKLIKKIYKYMRKNEMIIYKLYNNKLQ